MKKVTAFLLTFCLATLVMGCGKSSGEKTAGGLGKATDFEITDIKGNTTKLSDYSGKVIILNFFATWCPPCRAEMPDFNEIATEYKKDVEIIAMNVGREGMAVVQEFAEKNNLTFIVAVDSGGAEKIYGPIRAIPVTVVIDKNFNIARKYVGSRTKDVFVKDIEELR